LINPKYKHGLMCSTPPPTWFGAVQIQLTSVIFLVFLRLY